MKQYVRGMIAVESRSEWLNPNMHLAMLTNSGLYKSRSGPKQYRWVIFIGPKNWTSTGNETRSALGSSQPREVKWCSSSVDMQVILVKKLQLFQDYSYRYRSSKGYPTSWMVKPVNHLQPRHSTWKNIGWCIEPIDLYTYTLLDVLVFHSIGLLFGNTWSFTIWGHRIK